MGWEVPTDSPLGIVITQGVPYKIYPLMGTQYYDLGRKDELNQWIWPEEGEALQLVREPENRVHSNAIAVYCNNGQHQIGHVPWGVADTMAPLMDQGVLAMCYMAVRRNG